MNGLSEILETGEAERVATGFVFTEGPLWHPDGFYYFVDVRQSRFYRLRPGGQAELLRENTVEGKRLNRPNDVVCRSDGSIWFTDPGLRVPVAEREQETAAVYRVSPDGVV